MAMAGSGCADADGAVRAWRVDFESVGVELLDFARHPGARTTPDNSVEDAIALGSFGPVAHLACFQRAACSFVA